MRLLPFAVALILAIPATVVVALPRAMPDVIEPLNIPLSGGSEHGDHGSEHDDAAAPGGEQADKHAAASPSQPAPGHSHGRVRTAWPPAEGAIPTSRGALVEVRDILIEGEPDLKELAEIGVTITGRGTLADPYVLEGLWVTRELEIKDTADYYVVRSNLISGTLRLNWNDDRLHVHHNDVRDLRVNENIERSGEATGGLIELNRFGVVGQIRHFDGVFRVNDVGPAPSGSFDDVIEDSGAFVPFFGLERTLNIDGFDGAIFEGNTIVGYVEMQLHGHHHASCFECHSHNHAVAAKTKHDHTIRYHEADFIGNTITVERGVAFRYTDAAHRGDDRTANSEPNEALRAPHLHFTRIAIEDNVIQGGPLVIDILNADSADHANEATKVVEPVGAFAEHAYRADLTVRGNKVAWAVPDKPLTVPWFEDAIRDGILVRSVKEAQVHIADNLVVVTGAVEPSPLAALPGIGTRALLAADAPAALHLLALRSARVVVDSNTLEGAHFGVLAQEFGDAATWTLLSNEFHDVSREVEHDAQSAPES